jgi:hypothetical protein
MSAMFWVGLVGGGIVEVSILIFGAEYFRVRENVADYWDALMYAFVMQLYIMFVLPIHAPLKGVSKLGRWYWSPRVAPRMPAKVKATVYPKEIVGGHTYRDSFCDTCGK